MKKLMASRASINVTTDGGSVPIISIRFSKSVTVEQIARRNSAPNRQKETSISTAITMSTTSCTQAVH